MELKAERFRVSLENSHTHEKDSVTVEVSLDGLKILSADGSRTKQVYPLKAINRWEIISGSSLILYTKTSASEGERQVKLYGDSKTCQMILDTLTSFRFMKSELVQETSNEGIFGERRLGKSFRRSQNSRHESMGADDVEFWVRPDKKGWLYSQGEYLKTWRRRWFVLKSGYLFRFLDDDVNHASEPRGCVDLSTVIDISEGSATTGKPHTVKLSMSGSKYVALCTDTETDLVEWISALDKAHQEIMKRVAGVDDDIPQSSSSSAAPSKKNHSGDTVSVVGYDTFAATAPPLTSDLALNYGDVDGVSRAVPKTSGNPVVPVNYGSGEIPQPSLYPSPQAPPSYTPPVYNGSILDQTPHQTPSYPSYQTVHSMDYCHPQPPPPQTVWKTYYTADGRAFYHNAVTGQSQWDRPLDPVL